MGELFTNLTAKCKERGLTTQRDIAKEMKKSLTYISQRFTAKKPWDMDDQYWFMDNLGITHTLMYYYFPKGGKL